MEKPQTSTVLRKSRRTHGESPSKVITGKARRQEGPLGTPRILSVRGQPGERVASVPVQGDPQGEVLEPSVKGASAVGPLEAELGVTSMATTSPLVPTSPPLCACLGSSSSMAPRASHREGGLEEGGWDACSPCCRSWSWATVGSSHRPCDP